MKSVLQGLRSREVAVYKPEDNMNYNERTGEFEESRAERIGYWIGCHIWWACKILVLAAVCWFVWNMLGRLFGVQDHE